MFTKKNPKGAGRKQKGFYKHEISGPVLRKSFPYNGNYVIYGLTSSVTPEIIEYVGFTERTLYGRYNNHISTANANGTNKEQWVKQILDEGNNLVLVVLKDGIETLKEACECEQFYIQQLSELFPLKNITKGGIGTLGMVHKPETKVKQSIANKGRVRRKVQLNVTGSTNP